MIVSFFGKKNEAIPKIFTNPKIFTKFKKEIFQTYFSK
jgi:hypothetical protein